MQINPIKPLLYTLRCPAKPNVIYLLPASPLSAPTSSIRNSGPATRVFTFPQAGQFVPASGPLQQLFPSPAALLLQMDASFSMFRFQAHCHLLRYLLWSCPNHFTLYYLDLCTCHYLKLSGTLYLIYHGSAAIRPLPHRLNINQWSSEWSLFILELLICKCLDSPFIFGIFGKVTCFWNLTKPDDACLPSLIQSCATSSRISRDSHCTTLHNSRTQIRPRFYKSHWNILLPEKLECHWTGAFKPETARS